jgi:hypothetical protein
MSVPTSDMPSEKMILRKAESIYLWINRMTKSGKIRLEQRRCYDEIKSDSHFIFESKGETMHLRKVLKDKVTK